METKSLFQSKTFWVNLASGLSAVIALIDPSLLGVDPRWLLLASGAVNIFLRTITSGAVSLSAPKPE